MKIDCKILPITIGNEVVDLPEAAWAEILRLRLLLNAAGGDWQNAGTQSHGMWAIVWPDGRVVTGSDLQDEAHAWQIALGWPDTSAIDEARQEGAKAVYGRFFS